MATYQFREIIEMRGNIDRIDKIYDLYVVTIVNHINGDKITFNIPDKFTDSILENRNKTFIFYGFIEFDAISKTNEVPDVKFTMHGYDILRDANLLEAVESIKTL